ncbi:MAG: sigma-70 family RNA polymerase sigma factor [Oscillospiraceae bacterium]|nr:sigma-70 family RNA polymerase sigma factor [Oscillospiraceae bacterium]
MEDEKITALLTERSERGLSALKSKYNLLILKISRGILRSPEDAEEVTNDTLLAVWNGIPPDKPQNLRAYVCRIARRKAIDKLRYNTAAARNSDILTELDECVPAGYSVEDNVEKAELAAALNDWLNTLDDTKRQLFTLRYFYMETVKTAAKSCKMSETAASTSLQRLRENLKKYLTERGLFYE